MAAVSASLNGTGLHIAIARKVFPAVGRRGPLDVLRGISLDIDERSFVVITGPSGCGKSTMLNIVASLDKDYEGRIDFGVGDPRLAFVFQAPRLLPWRTVAENVALVLSDGDPREAGVGELLDRVGLSAAKDAYPERISLGMQRRVALARAFVLEPDILLMDEPFVSLDDPTAQDLRQLLIDLWNRRPTTVLFVTHDRTEAVMLGTRLLQFAPGNGSSSIVHDAPISLSRAARADRDAVAVERRRIFGE